MFSLDAGLPPEVSEVLACASLLDVSEYRVFEMAHCARFGSAADRARLERLFFAYLYLDRVPPWVERFARGVAARGRAPDFDPAEYGVVRPRPRRTMVYPGVRYALWTAGALAAIALAAHFAAEPLGCMFPPCY